MLIHTFRASSTTARHRVQRRPYRSPPSFLESHLVPNLCWQFLHSHALSNFLSRRLAILEMLSDTLISSYLSRINPVPAFPPYTGPYKVGTVDVEIPVSDLQSPVPTPENAHHIKTIQFRIFYPAAEGATGKNIPWLPNPQRAYVVGYTQFFGIGPLVAEILSFLPRHLHYATIPVLKNATLHAPVASFSGNPDSEPSAPGPVERRWPTMIFCHGLIGSRNVYSHVAGSIASHGVVVFCPEHRDGTSVVSYIRDPEARPSIFSSRASGRLCLRYQRIAHEGTTEVWAARDNQLRVRCWELGLLHNAIQALDTGREVRNLNDSTPIASMQNFRGTLDIHRPGSMVFGGHSFGSSTVVQFLKSVFYHDHPKVKSMTNPLCQPDPESDLVQQVTPKTVTILLDMWCFPLVSPSTRELLDLPLPAYTSTPTCPAPGGSAILAVESSSFYKLNRHLHLTARVLSPLLQPSSATITPNIFETKDGIRLPGPNFFYVDNSVHISQSDFSVLFPWATKKVFGVEAPERVLRLNQRAILQVLRANGIAVSDTWVGDLLEGGSLEHKENTQMQGDAKTSDTAPSHINVARSGRATINDDPAILERSDDDVVDYWHWIDVIGLGNEANIPGAEDASGEEAKEGTPIDGQTEHEIEEEIETHLATHDTV